MTTNPTKRRYRRGSTVRPHQRIAFLRHLAQTGSVTDAASAAGCDRSTVYRLRDRVPEFGELWEGALAMATGTTP